jgi:hypothetical protein
MGSRIIKLLTIVPKQSKANNELIVKIIEVTTRFE